MTTLPGRCPDAIAGHDHTGHDQPRDDDVEAALAAVARCLYGATSPPDAVIEHATTTLTVLAAAAPQLVEVARTALGAPGR